MSSSQDDHAGGEFKGDGKYIAKAILPVNFAVAWLYIICISIVCWKAVVGTCPLYFNY